MQRPHSGTAIVAMNESNRKSIFLGADVASRHVDIGLHGQDKCQRIGNDEQAIIKWLRGVPRETVLAMESTGRYHRLLAKLAHEHGLRVYVLNPRDVKHYARAVGQRGKTDRLDALLLARYIAHEYSQLRLWEPLSPQQQQLQDLLNRRASIMRHKSALKQSLAHDADLGELMGQMLAPMERALALLDKRIHQAVLALPQGAQALRHVTSIPGIGLLNAAALLGLFQRLGHAGADAVVAFTGLDPRPMDSGNKRGVRRLSKRGSAELRRLLYNAAMSASRTDTWRPLYERERAKGLPTTAALIVLSRKLLRVAFSLFKTQSTFDPHRLALSASA